MNRIIVIDDFRQAYKSGLLYQVSFKYQQSGIKLTFKFILASVFITLAAKIYLWNYLKATEGSC